MTKAGLFTYHFSDNYDALDKAYGLRQWLRGRGTNAGFVNYHPTNVEEGGQLDRMWKLFLWRKNATILYMKQAHLRRRMLGGRGQNAQFGAFRRDVLGVNGPRLKLPQDLVPEMAQYDVLFSGSDQIWNPSLQRGLDLIYFLDILNSGQARKVAYAPSFGQSALESKYNAELDELVGNLDGISARELTGLDVLECAGIARANIHVMPDPTILLGAFDDLLGVDLHPEFAECLAPHLSQWGYDASPRQTCQDGARSHGQA